MIKVNDFITMLKKALNSNTIYCTGMFGQPITTDIIESKSKQYPSNYNSTKVSKLKSLVDRNYFGFDCVCLIKGILWGWNGDTENSNGGAVYNSNNVPDVDTEGLYAKCKTSTDFSNIIPGALVWMKGHVGIYIGNGNVIECTAAWTGNVLESRLGNLGYTGTYVRSWTGWGKLPYIDYNTDINDTSASTDIAPTASTSAVNPSASTTSTSISAPNTATAVVKNGEGYWQIAERLGMTDRFDEIVSLNNNKALYTGDTILIPNAGTSSDICNTTSFYNTPAESAPTTSVAYDTFVSELKTALGLSSNATPQQIFVKTPLLKNDNKYNKVTVVLQKYLIALGFSCGDNGADGYFGNKTEIAVKNYQKKYKTGIADGYLSAKGYMWKSLLKLT